MLASTPEFYTVCFSAFSHVWYLDNFEIVFLCVCCINNLVEFGMFLESF